MVLLISFCVALCELCSVLLFILVFEHLQPKFARLADCRYERRTPIQKTLTKLSDISDKVLL